MATTPQFNINIIPDEVLAEIFARYVDSCDPRSGFARDREVSYKARAILCGINRRLRHIAIHHHQLWAHVQFRGQWTPMPLIELYVERSGNFPIEVDLYGPYPLSCGHPQDNGDPRHEALVIELLRPHLHRWKSFKIFFGDASAGAFAALPLETAAELTKIEAVSPCSQELDDQILASIEKLPTLHKISWDKYYISEDDVSSFQIAIKNAPWHTLIDVWLSCMMTPEETLQLFSALSSVEVIYLKLRRGPSPPLNAAARPLVRATKLRVLEIASDFGIYETLQYLDAPNLEILLLSTHRFYSNGPHIACKRFRAFLDRSSGSLGWLSLSSFDFSRTDASEFFDNPLLVNIPIVKFCIDDDHIFAAAESSLNRALAGRQDVTRHLTSQSGNGFGACHVLAWVDDELKEKYMDGLGYRPGLGSWYGL